MTSLRAARREDFGAVRAGGLLLRAPEASDAVAVLAVHGDPDANRFNPAGPMREGSQAAETLERWRAEWAREGFGYWAVSADDDDAVIAFGGIARRTWRRRPVLNLYFRVAPPAWGRGVASAVAGRAVQLASRHLADLPIVARTRPGNVAAIRVALHAGLQRRPDLDDEHLVLARGWAPPSPPGEGEGEG
jgi:ribosomal-protein-alanine N-acetyltransferase